MGYLLIFMIEKITGWIFAGRCRRSEVGKKFI
jgi:hypothetical protein